MELDHARNYVDQLLTKADIKAVYYIDDYLSYDGLKAIASFIEEQPIDVLQALIPTLDEKVLYAKQASVSDLPVYISTWWESLNDTEQDYVLKCCDCQSKGLSEENLKSILGKKCVFCTPEKWESLFSRECLAFIQRGEKVLLLFDFKLGMFSTDGEGRNGISLANSFNLNYS